MEMIHRSQSSKDRLDIPIKAAYDKGVGAKPGSKFGIKPSEIINSGFAFSLRKGEPLTVNINATTKETIKIPY